MAGNNSNRKVTITGHTKGVTEATKKVKGLGKATTETARRQNEIKRAQEGVHKTSLSTAKAFSKQQQGLGGLVRAYATVAANIFALTAAFGILRRAADFMSMMISAENLESRLGMSVSNIAKEMQRATGHALDFRQSLENTNRALSAGFSSAQTAELADVIARASQTFGGSVEANMNKAISAVLRGRTETLSTMGIVIDLNKAYVEYAASIGKTGKELSKYEQKQAVINALLTEGKANLEGIQLDANPFQILANTFFDTAQDILKVVVNLTQPFIKLINLSKDFAVLVIGVLGAIFAKNLTPDIEQYSAKAVTAFERVQIAVERQRTSVINLAKAQTQANLKAIARDVELKRKSVKAWILEEGRKVNAVTKGHKTLKSLFLKMETDGINAFKNMSTATRRELGTLSANLTRYINDPSDKSVMKSIQGMAIAEAKQLRDQLDIGMNQQRHMNRVVAQSTAAANTWALSLRKVSTQLSLASANIMNAWTSQRLVTMRLIQDNGLLLGSYKALILTKWTAIDATAGYVQAGGRLPGLFRVIARGAAVASASVGIFSAFLQTLPMIIGTITMAFFAWNIIKDKLGIGKLSEEMEAFKKAIEDSDEVMKNYNRRLSDFQALRGRTKNLGLAGISQESTFVANSLEELLLTTEAANAEFNRLGYLSDGRVAADVLEETASALATVSREAKFGADNLGRLLNPMREMLFLRNLSKIEDKLDDPNLSADARKDLEARAQVYRDLLGFSKQETDLIHATSVATAQMTERLKMLPDLISNAFSAMRQRSGFLDNVQEGLGNEFSETAQNNIRSAITQALQSTSLTEHSKEGILNYLELVFKGADPKRLAEVVANAIAAIPDMESARFLDALSAAFQGTGIETRALVESFRQLGNAANAILTDIAPNITKLRSEKGNVFFEKAGVNEEVRLIQQLITNLDNVKSSGRDTEKFMEEFRKQSSVMSFLELPADVGFEAALAAAQGYLEQFRDYAKDKVMAPLNEEVRKVAVELNKLEHARTVSAERRGNLIEEQVRLERQSLSAQINSNRLAAEARENSARALTYESEAGRILLREAYVLREQNKLLVAQRNLLNPILANALERLSVEREITNARIASTNIIIGAETRLKNLLGDTTSIYAAQVEIFKKRESVLRQQAQAFGSEVQSIQLKVKAGDANLDDLKKLIALEGQIIAQMVEVKALARETARVTIRSAANDGSMESKQQSFLLQFVEAGEELARSMEDSGMRAAKGISDAVTKSFDTAVDMLLEGTGDFIEAFKGILRETLGDFLKQNINEATTLLFADLAKNKLLSMGEGAKDSVQELALDTTRLNTTALGLLRTEITRLITVLGAPSIDTAMPMSKLTEGEGPSTGILNSIAGNTAMTTAATENVASTVLTEGFQQVVHTTELAALQAISIGVGTLVMGQIQTNALLGLLGASETGGSIIEGLGAAFMGATANAADGAIFDGGLKRYASGGITSGPELALIGEGKNREAVIPMPNNKEVPVQLLGSGGNDVNITNVYDFRDANPSSETKLRAHSEKIKRDTFNNVFNEINKGGSYAKMVGRRK